MHCLCYCDCDAKAGEAAGPYGDVDVFDLAGLSSEAFEQCRDGREDLGTVRHWGGEDGLGKQLGAESQCDGAYSAGRFQR